jgi:Flp pilus assembly protein TadB
MTGAAAWILVAAAVLLLPGARAPVRPVTAGPSDSAAGVGGSRRPALGSAVAVGGLGCACVALLGLRAGVLTAAVLGPGAAIALRVLQRRPERVRLDRSLALTLDLAAASLRAGRPAADALAGAAPAAAPALRDALDRVAGLLRLGADPQQAWAVVGSDGPLGPVAVTAVRSATSGIRLAAAFERLADETRAEIVAVASARAHRAGVLSMAPLGACFLPSFVCLGVIPVVVGIARGALGVLP